MESRFKTVSNFLLVSSAALVIIIFVIILYISGKYLNSFSIVGSLKIILTTDEYRHDQLLRDLPDTNTSEIIFTQDIMLENIPQDIINNISSFVAFPLIEKQQSSSTAKYILPDSSHPYDFKLAKFLSKDSYVFIKYNKPHSSLELVINAENFRVFNESLKTKEIVLSEIFNVPEKGVLEIAGNFVPLNESLNFPVKLGVIQNTELQVYKEDSLLKFATFEDAIWQKEASDCSNSMSGVPDIGIDVTSDATEGKHAMKLFSSNHYACAFHTFPIELDNDKVYKLQFDYKNISGGKMMYYYDLRQYENKKGYSYSEQLSPSVGKWNLSSTYIDPRRIIDTHARNEYVVGTEEEHALKDENYNDTGSIHDQVVSGNIHYLNLYLYAPSDGTSEVANIYDNVQFVKYIPVKRLSFDVSKHLNNSLDVAELYGWLNKPMNASYIVDANEQNMLQVEPATFEDAIWQKEASDCSNSMSGVPDIGIDVTSDATEGKHAMKLFSSNHYACAFHTFPIELDNDKVYKLQFDYKNISGGKMMYYYSVGNGSQNSSRSITVTANSGIWSKEIADINSEVIGPKYLTIGFYAPAQGGLYSENIFDNVSLNELTKKDISSYFLYSKIISSESTTSQISNGAIFRKNEKQFSLLNLSEGLFVKFSAPFSKYWELRLRDGSIIKNRYHYKLNGIENGWYVDPVALCGKKGSIKDGCTLNPDGSYNIDLIIEFTPQRWFYVGLIISGTTLLSCLLYLGYDFVKKK